MQSLIDEFLERRHGETRVRHDLLGAWQQGLASRISSIPIQAAADVFFEIGRYSSANAYNFQSASHDQNLAPWWRQTVPLLRSEEAAIADYVEREGLHETHLHLNGSTHAEVCWLRAIHDPYTEVRAFVDGWTRGKHAKHLRELVGQVNPDLTPPVLYRHLRAAGRLRTWLIGAADGRIVPNAQFPVSCEYLCSADNDEWSAGLTDVALVWQQKHDVGVEISWMARLVAKLRERPSVQLTRMFHTYLLLLNEHYRLLVQSEAQYGFDQFQKFTLTELRDPAEHDYRMRFQAMHGFRPAISTVGYLEGRFAPKDNLRKAYGLFKAILGGYLEYLQSAPASGFQYGRLPCTLSGVLAELSRHFEQPTAEHRSIHRLTLVAHFIKQPWSPLPKQKAGPYRHYSLDRQLRRTVGVLLSCLAQWPRLQNWVRGVDAAANELHAPPDVFAPAFRVCRRAGLTRRTYHAGEDFRHLLSGVATMWEALTLLDLRDGDRIGHGTAMGINPRLWVERMPGTVSLARGEWMLSVLSAWQLLREIPDSHECAHRLKSELEDVASQIFRCSLTARDVERVMALRGLSRRDVMRYQTDDVTSLSESLSEIWREETLLVDAAYRDQPQDMALLWRWLSDEDVLERSHELVERETCFVDASSYLRLQQALMQQVADRRVLIETLPSSNVRISQYHHVGEHHSLRWMRVPGYVEVGDPEIMVCLGSDDPGIFAGDLETEFYLLYTALRRSGLGDSDALHRLSVLNERGRTYRFHHPLLS
ncbi:hypothetical protein LGM89_08010 [Burkholderia sp. AU31624]|uniref:hypothetical protein n=1 Tax=Burkholderia sp. AU31624 TaxID=2879629 RepID=UPI001CF1F254|nr:hypothetical protein [Burkholderia sp. AU31624]MCA8253203.1 hypothetical protein [Burkholderia sp. AU31624]